MELFGGTADICIITRMPPTILHALIVLTMSKALSSRSTQTLRRVHGRMVQNPFSPRTCNEADANDEKGEVRVSQR